MHANLIKIQERMVENVKGNLKILELSDKRPLIILVLAIAEKQLTEAEIITRTGLNAKNLHSLLNSLTKNDLIKTVEDSAGKTVYELNPEIENVIAENIQEKINALKNNNMSYLAEYNNLVESAQAEFNDYDILMAKFLREKIKKVELITAIMSKRNSLLRLLDSDHAQSAEIKKISID